jgi:hypothetical protein
MEREPKTNEHQKSCMKVACGPSKRHTFEVRKAMVQ